MDRPGQPRRRGLLLIAGAVLLLFVASWAVLGLVYPGDTGAYSMDPENQEQVSRGKQVYASACMACHGADLQGQPDWRTRLPSGRLPASPHDETGHTWHHPDRILVGITRDGLVPPYAPADYESDMPAFGQILDDAEIDAVLAYIKSTWPEEVLEAQRELDRRDRQRGQ